MREFQNLVADSEQFHLAAGTYRNRFIADFRVGRSRPLELPDGDYSIALANGTTGLNVMIERE